MPTLLEQACPTPPHPGLQVLGRVLSGQAGFVALFRGLWLWAVGLSTTRKTHSVTSGPRPPPDLGAPGPQLWPLGAHSPTPLGESRTTSVPREVNSYCRGMMPPHSPHFSPPHIHTQAEFPVSSREGRCLLVCGMCVVVPGQGEIQSVECVFAWSLLPPSLTPESFCSGTGVPPSAPLFFPYLLRARLVPPN